MNRNTTNESNNDGDRMDKRNVEGQNQEGNDYPVDRILDHRFNKKGNPEFKVLWKGYSQEEASWEPLANVMENKQFEEYRREQCHETRKNIRVPDNIPVGNDDDGLCFRRAVMKLALSDVDPQQFQAWIPLKEGLNKLRRHEYSVKALRKNRSTKGKRLLMLRANHMRGANCKNRGYRRAQKDFYRVYVVTKMTRPKSIQASLGRLSSIAE